jgi:hypothetical protein
MKIIIISKHIKRDEKIGGWIKRHKKEVYNLYSSPSIGGWDGPDM